jgi:hypothetical protein
MNHLNKRTVLPLLGLGFLFLTVSAYFLLYKSDNKDNGMKLIDPGLFSAQECMQGCWRGLKPGTSSATDVVNFIHTEPTIKKGKSYEFHYQSSYSGYSVLVNDGHSQYELYTIVQKQTLRKISLQGNFNLTALDIITELGEPPYISLGYGADYRNGLFTRVSLYYPHEGYVFNIEPSIEKISTAKVRICTKQGDLIHGFEVFPPGPIQNILELEGSPDLLPIDVSVVEQRIQDLEPWFGFTCIERPYRS